MQYPLEEAYYALAVFYSTLTCKKEYSQRALPVMHIIYNYLLNIKPLYKHCADGYWTPCQKSRSHHALHHGVHTKHLPFTDNATLAIVDVCVQVF